MKKIYLVLFLTLSFLSQTNAQVVINEVYGGGGNSGATYKNDFIELYNNGTTAVNLTGWSVQYASSTGTTWARTALTGTIPAKSYYLIQEAQGTGGTVNLPVPDATGTIAMSGTAGKIALVNNNITLTGSCPTGAAIIDFVGFGGANCFEGTGPTPAPSNTTSVQRTPIGADNNNNSTDFEVVAPSPNNASGGIDVTAPTITSLSPADNATNAATSFTATITFNETIQKSTGTILLKRSSDNSTVQTIDVSTGVTVSGSTASFDISSLQFNTGYYFEISSGAFKDLANNSFSGIAVSSTWNFTTAATPVFGTIGTTYSFNNCVAGLADGFIQYSTIGAQKWVCSPFGRDASNPPSGNAPYGVEMNGFASTNVVNEDWLISPAFDLTSTTYPLLSFYSRTKFNGAPLQLKISTDYTGTGDPRLATWTDLNGRFPDQTSDVWTLSNNINLAAYKQAKVFIAFVYTSTEDDGARWTVDDFKIENSATPPPPSLSVSTTDVQFTFVANGSTGDKTFSFTGNDITSDVTLIANGNFLLSKDGSSFSSSITYTVAEANNSTKTVYVRFAPNQVNQNFTGSITISTSSLSNIINLKGSSIDPAGTLEVVNWNIEWFGSTGFGPTNEAQQEQNIKTVLQNIGADIYGLVEVVDETKLANVVSQMHGYTYVIGNYGSHVNPPDATGGPLSEAQKLAFVYKTSVFSNVSVRPLINNLDTKSTSYNNWSSGRYPFLMSADVTLNCVTKRMNFVLIHAKANTAPTAGSYARRKAAADELHDTLMTYFADANVIVLGDFNDDLDQTITDGIKPPTTSYVSFTADPANFFSPTLALSLAGKKSTVSYNDVIDHVMLSNEMVPYYMNSTATILTEVSTLVSNYGSTTTDHYPVFTRYQFEQPAPPAIVTCPAATAFCINSNNTYTVPAFTATSSCGAISYNYVVSGATSRTGTTNDASGTFNTGENIITWTATDGLGNTSTCQTKITINPNPIVTIPDAYALPSGVVPNTVYIGYAPASSITLQSNVTTTAGISTYNWSNGSTVSTATVNPVVVTTYTLTVTDANGCSATASKTIGVLDVRAGKKMDKVQVCHKVSKQRNTLEIGTAGVADHLAHGDMLGSCEETLLVSNQYQGFQMTKMEQAASEFKVIASPNPSTGYFLLNIQGGSNSSEVSLKVLDVLGRVVEKKANIPTNQSIMIGADYRPGVYLIEVVNGLERKQIKLLKSKN